jgi:hypothetical protein
VPSRGSQQYGGVITHRDEAGDDKEDTMARTRSWALALLITTLYVAPARAEPIPITAGSLNSGTLAFDFRAVFSLSVEGGRIEGEWPRGTVAASSCAGGCAPGTAVSPNAIWLNPEIPSEFASPRPTGSVLGNGPFLSGSLLFLGDPLVLPGAGLPPAGGELVLSQPFSFTGWMAAYPSVVRGPFVPEQLILLDLLGLGTAHLRFRLDALPDGRPRLIYRDTTYEFEPVPEPFTMLTVGTGLALLWRRRRPLSAAKP